MIGHDRKIADAIKAELVSRLEWSAAREVNNLSDNDWEAVVEVVRVAVKKELQLRDVR